jgi:spore coat polysaccharide biosynthesis protein SpsF (cytidylyltransferase family)
MSVVAIIQARMGSTRLPGKVMAALAGQPLLARVIERAPAIPGVDDVVVATTVEERDEVVVRLAKTLGVDAFAGSPEDVLDRYYRSACQAGAFTVVRITADCPLLDPQASGRALARFLQGDVDYVTNCRPPTYPDGLDTEVFSFTALEQAWQQAQLLSDREHVTPYIWKHPNRFRVANVAHDEDLSTLRWTVDEPQDLQFVRAVYGHLHHDGRLFGMQEVLQLLRQHPEMSAINQGIGRNEGYVKSLQGDRRL